MSKNKSCVVIGAGMAGLAAASVLRQSGWEVVLLDKASAVGGRMATRRIGESRFDHGAQFFTVRDSRFQESVNQWQARGWVMPWFTEGGHIRYRGTDGMGGIAEELAKPFDVRTATNVARVEPVESGWRIWTEDGEELRASSLLLTAPAPQSANLLSGCMNQLPASVASSLNDIEFDPCFALLAILAGPSVIPPPGLIRPDAGPISLISDNVQKGISAGAAALTIHARADFTRSYFDRVEAVAPLLLEAAEPWLGSEVLTWQLHRWKYSQPIVTCAGPCLYSSEPAPLAFAGDAFGGPRIEGAFLSGMAAAKQLIGDS